MDPEQVVGYCSSEVSPVSMEAWDYESQDVVLIFTDPEFQRAECILREDLRRLYEESEVKVWREEEKLVKLPFSGLWVKNADLVFENPNRATFVLDEGKEIQIGSYFGESRIHGAVEPVRTLSLAPIWNMTIRSIENAQHDPRERIGEEEIEEDVGEGEDVIITTELTHLDLRGRRIRSLDLRGSHELVSFLLPRGLKILNCSVCFSLTSMPRLPQSLISLNCSECPQLASLSRLPVGLRVLQCYLCPLLVSLSHLPDRLQLLNCNSCESLTTIQAPLPPGLQDLDCSNCRLLTSLPPLPENLIGLNCLDCYRLEALPPLPESLQELNCDSCRTLISLPPLPEGLQELNCGLCRSLTSLPPLPPGLLRLNCSNCPLLTSLPPLPAGLQNLDCSNCPLLTSLPPLPNTIRSIRADGCTGLVTRPDIPPGTRFSCNGCPFLEE